MVRLRRISAGDFALPEDATLENHIIFYNGRALFLGEDYTIEGNKIRIPTDKSNGTPMDIVTYYEPKSPGRRKVNARE